MPTLTAAGRILSAAIILALSGVLPFSFKDGNTQSSDLAYGALWVGGTPVEIGLNFRVARPSRYL